MKTNVAKGNQFTLFLLSPILTKRWENVSGICTKLWSWLGF